MSYKKNDVQKSSEGRLVKQYLELVRLCPNTMKVSDRPLTTLKQPSLLEEVDSITTYGLTK